MNAKKPNVLLITSDQQHFSTLSHAANNPHIQTPNLDRLARMGMNFTRAYCPNPTCTPTRASLITGQYPSVHGAWTLGTKTPTNIPFVGDLFREAGYDVSLIGKAHFQPLGDREDDPQTHSIEKHPYLRDMDFWNKFNQTQTPWYGFNHIETCRNHADEAHAGGHYAQWMLDQGFSDWEQHYQPVPGSGVKGEHREHKWSLPEQYHYSVWTAERTVARIELCVANNQPFYCWSSFHDPHPPYLVPEPWDTMYNPDDVMLGELHIHEDGTSELDKMPPPHQMTQQRDSDWSGFNETKYGSHGYKCHLTDREQLKKDVAVYYGMTSLMDREIGKILDALEQQGVLDNTLIVFTTDHGHYYGHHGLTAKGAFHYDDGIRLPFLAAWPGHIAPDSTTDAITNLVDLPATFLDACGLDVPIWMQGKSQLPVWTGQADRVNDHTICEFHHQPHSVHLRTLITERYKFTLYRGHTDWGELFDLETDPGEVDNKFHDPAYADVKAELFEKFMQAELEREPMLTLRTAGA